MKKIILFAATLVLTAACNKEISMDGNVSDRINVTADLSKTEISHADGKFSFVWKTGDAVSLMEYVSEEMSFKSGTSDPLVSDAKTAAFTVKLDPQSLGKGNKFSYVAVYPANDKFGIMGWNGTDADAYPILSVEIPSEQQLPSNTSFDPAADILVSNVADALARPEDLSLCFARIGGILQLHLTGLPTEGASKYIEQGSISAYGSSYCFSGAFLYYPGDTMIETLSSGTASQTILFSALPGACAIVNGESDVFLRCCSGNLSGSVSLALTANVDGEQRVFKKDFVIGGDTGDGAGGSAGAGGSTGTGGDGGNGIAIANGKITRVSIAVEEDVTPNYIVVLSGIGAGTDKCGVEAEVIDVKGKGLSDLNAHVFYGTTPAATPEEFMGKSTYASAGKVPDDGKFFYEISGLTASTKYYLVVAVDDGKNMYTNDKVEEFQTETPKTPLSKVSSVEFDTTNNSFSAFWDSVTGAVGYDCIYWNETASSSKQYLSAKYEGGKWSATATGLKAGKYCLQVIPIPDSSHSECTENDTFNVTISDSGPTVVFSAECKDGWLSIVGKVEKFSCSGQYAYIHWDEGTLSEPGTITMRDGAPLGSDGSFSYVKEVKGAFTEGKTYSFCVSVNDGYNSYYSKVEVLDIPGSGTEAKLTIAVGNFQVKGTGSSGVIMSATVSGDVNDSAYFGKDVYIFVVQGTYSKVADVALDKNKKTMCKTSSTAGTYSASTSGLIQGKTYSFCAGLNTGTGYIYSDVFTCTATSGK